MVFSPDSRYIAYDLAVGDGDAGRHVYVMAIDGSETDLVANPGRNVVMAWSPDGRTVLFSSDRSGETGLWGQTVAHGKPQGLPTLLKRDIGSSYSLGMTTSGTMNVYKAPSANFVQVASLDLHLQRGRRDARHPRRPEVRAQRDEFDGRSVDGHTGALGRRHVRAVGGQPLRHRSQAVSRNRRGIATRSARRAARSPVGSPRR